MIASLAATVRAQHGVFSRRQALAAGYSDRQISWALRQDAWHACYPGVYRVAGAPATWHSRVWASLLAAGSDAVLSYRIAGRVHRVDGTPTYNAVDICVAPSRRPRSVPGAHIHREQLPRTSIARRGGFPVTTPARTVVDLARTLPLSAGAHVMGDALRTGIVVPAALSRELDAARRRPGAQRARTAASLANPALESVLEGDLAPLLLRAGVIATAQYEVFARGSFLARLDFAVAELKLGIEADGYGTHGRRGQFERDHERAAMLRLAGWTVLSFTAEQIRNRPEWVINVVEQMVAQLRAARNHRAS